jgi:hypothetical protein
MPKVFGEIANAGWQQGIANRKAAADFLVTQWRHALFYSATGTMAKSSNFEEIANAG